eukprot:TRINITY_DN6729_c0_g1_i1.p1 TRINITY_DN6729_c0_g1~~TRINITY_DN6729_c0_g1_i1.p1  ORF type:complete len:999 (-),score=245.19 TRINITY_DN6729_c0_g1_i1:23-3019(-)
MLRVLSSKNRKHFRQRRYTTSKRGPERILKKYQLGDNISGYTLEGTKYVPEKNITAYMLTHTKTGARHLHLDCDDTNNVFMKTFKTTPRDSTGVAHVLEHTTLCGSEKYPVKDPFFNMLKRSLKTEMNAWTGGDFTSYIFSTENEQDYKNLLSVYADAVYHPKLEPLDFMQEGHHLEFEEIDNPESNLIYKGVVFNEMKGALADSGSLFMEDTNKYLYPTITYGVNSGGDPEVIPKLTYEDLVDFHKKHYHPSNSYTITYGDISMENHLEKLDVVMSDFDKYSPDTAVGDETRWNESRSHEITGPASTLTGDDKDDNMVSLTWLTNNLTDMDKTVGMTVLGYLLLEGPNAPLYQKLIETHLGNNYVPNVGYSSHSRETNFVVGLQGVQQEDIPAIEETIIAVLEEACENGFDPKRIEAVLNIYEISQKHVTTSYGMNLASSIVGSWIHGFHPFGAVSVEEMLNKLKQNMEADPKYFQNLIKEQLLDNKHRLKLVMKPDTDYSKKVSEKEEKKLEQVKQNLTESNIQQIIEDANKLQERQNTPPDVDKLPKLTVKDINREKPEVQVIYETLDNIKLNIIPQPTNGITYFRTAFDISNIPEELLNYVPLFTNIITELGTVNRDHRQLAQDIETNTGSFSASYNIYRNPKDHNEYYPRLIFSSSALQRKIPDMFSIWEDIFNNGPLLSDLDNLLTNIMMIESNMQESINSDGLSFASSYAMSGIHGAGKLSEEWGGITQYELIAPFVEEGYDLNSVVQKLKDLSEFVFTKCKMELFLHCEESEIEPTKQHLSKFLSSIEKANNDRKLYGKDFTPTFSKTYFPSPAGINFVTSVFPSVPTLHPLYPKLNVLTKVITHYLHVELREKGSAYGCGCYTTPGAVSFYSYRDPNVEKTIDTYKESIDWACSGKFDNDDVDNAKIAIFSNVDKPVSPSNKGYMRILSGLSHDDIMRNRIGMLDVNKKELVEVANEVFKGNNANIAVFGSDKNLKDLSDDWKVIDKLK